MFAGCALYKQRVHRDRDVVEVVVTKPPAPSRFNDELAAAHGAGWGLIDSGEALPAIAEAAHERFFVMTSYLDAVAAPVVANLFQRVARGVRKVLIVRAEANDEIPVELGAVRPILKELNVAVLNFRVERDSVIGNETSRAKVVLADDILAYVGSLNMNRWSLSYSLELGEAAWCGGSRYRERRRRGGTDVYQAHVLSGRPSRQDWRLSPKRINSCAQRLGERTRSQRRVGYTGCRASRYRALG